MHTNNNNSNKCSIMRVTTPHGGFEEALLALGFALFIIIMSAAWVDPLHAERVYTDNSKPGRYKKVFPMGEAMMTLLARQSAREFDYEKRRLALRGGSKLVVLKAPTSLTEHNIPLT